MKACQDNTLERVLAFSPDSQSFLAGWDLKTAKVWRLDTGHELHQIPAGRVTSAVFSHDGKHVLTGNDSGESILWNAATGNRLHTYLHKLESQSLSVETVAFLRDGQTLFTSDPINGHLWDTTTGAELATVYLNAKHIKLAPDGKRLLVDDFPAKVLDIQTGQTLYSTSDSGGDFSPDGQYLITYNGETSTLRDAQTFARIQDFIGHYPRFSPGSDYLFTMQGESDLVLWDVKKSINLHLFPSTFFPGVVFSPTNEFLVVPTPFASEPKRTLVRLWNMEKATEQRQFDIEAWMLNAPVVSPNGRYIAFALDSGSILIWDVQASKKLYTFC